VRIIILYCSWYVMYACVDIMYKVCTVICFNSLLYISGRSTAAGCGGGHNGCHRTHTHAHTIIMCIRQKNSGIFIHYYNMYYYYYVFLSSVVVVVPTNRYLITLFFSHQIRARVCCSSWSRGSSNSIYTRFSSRPNDRLIDTNRHVKNSCAVCASSMYGGMCVC